LMAIRDGKGESEARQEVCAIGFAGNVGANVELGGRSRFSLEMRDRSHFREDAAFSEQSIGAAFESEFSKLLEARAALKSSERFGLELDRLKGGIGDHREEERLGFRKICERIAAFRDERLERELDPKRIERGIDASGSARTHDSLDSFELIEDRVDQFEPCPRKSRCDCRFTDRGSAEPKSIG